jgi:hypothetical protein
MGNSFPSTTPERGDRWARGMIHWRDMTWRERLTSIAIWIGTTVGFLVVIFFFLVEVVGPSLDGIDRYNSEHRRCLKNATNGLEIERCH